MKSQRKPNPVEPSGDEQQPDPFSTSKVREDPSPTTSNGGSEPEAIAPPLIEQKAIAPPVAAAQPGDGISFHHKSEEDPNAEEGGVDKFLAAAALYPTTADSDPLFANTRPENGCLIYEGTELLDSKTQRCIYRFGEVLRKDKLQVEIMAIYELYVPLGYIESRFNAAMNK